jgi:hypothetical protein
VLLLGVREAGCRGVNWIGLGIYIRAGFCNVCDELLDSITRNSRSAEEDKERKGEKERVKEMREDGKERGKDE